MSNTIYLYLKTHNKTGLKYLGKTERDPYTYQGSGKLWKKHINKHGYDVTTEILFETTDLEEFRKVGLEYSEKLNIVESEEFANLMVEYGDGAIHTEETRQKISESTKATMNEKSAKHSEIMKRVYSDPEKRKAISERLMGHEHSEETKQKISETLKGRPRSEETKRKISEAMKNRKRR